jgi:hypothetical protein
MRVNLLEDFVQMITAKVRQHSKVVKEFENRGGAYNFAKDLAEKTSESVTLMSKVGGVWSRETIKPTNSWGGWGSRTLGLRNPSSKWIKVSAIKFNKDGSISLKK